MNLPTAFSHGLTRLSTDVGRALRVLLGLQPLTTTAYPLRVLPDNSPRRAKPALHLIE
jgi:hypothetical protein